MSRARDIANLVGGATPDIILKTSDGAILNLQTSDTTVAADGVLGAINFQAPDEASGTDSILIASKIEAIAEDTFAADNNKTKLVFSTGESAAASAKASITSGGDVKVLTDGASIFFGADSEIELRHVADDGLILKHVGTADGKEPSLTFQAGDNDIAANDVLGSIFFQAPDEGAGTDAILVAAGIEAVSEGDFSSSSNATSLIFKTGASEAAAEQMRITSAGRVGIGTTDIDAALDIVDSVEYVRISNTTSDDTTKSGGLAVRHRDNEEEDVFVIGGVAGSSSNVVNIGGSDTLGNLNAASQIAFHTAADRTTLTGSERMRIAEDGRVGVGESDPSARFVVSSTGIGEHPCQIFGTSATFGNNVVELRTSRNTTNGSYNFLQAEVTSVGSRAKILDSGDLQNANGTYGSISDQNLKENIVDASSQWADIKSLKVRKFNFKESTGMPSHTQIGLIAQEVETVSAGLVQSSSWITKEIKDADGNLTSGGKETWKSVKSSIVHMKSLKALQEAMTRIETLETKVKTLEGG